MNKFQAAILAALVAPSFAAQAATADWYILSGGQVKCLSAKAGPTPSIFSSPASLEQYARATGSYRSTNVERNVNGDIVQVFVKAMDTIIAYYPSRELCAKAREYGLRNGILTDPEELK